MSIYWGYYCEQCDTRSGRGYNHGNDMLSATISLAPQIRALQVNQGASWLEIKLMGDDDGILSFLLDHYDHGVALINEFGEIQAMAEQQGEGEQDDGPC